MGRVKMQLPEQEVIALFHESKSIQAVATYFNCSEGPIRRVLKENGVDTSMYTDYWHSGTKLSREDVDDFVNRVRERPDEFERARKELRIGEKRGKRLLALNGVYI